MASIEKRPRSDGTTGYRVVWRENGRKDFLTFDDPTEAKRLKQLLEANGHSLAAATQIMQAVRANIPTVADILEQHITALTGVEARTRKDYRRLAADHINPDLGALPITAPDRNRIRAWINDRVDAGMGPKTLRNTHALLSAAFTWVNTEQPALRADNPAKGLRLPDYHPAEATFLTPAEFDVLLGHLRPPYRDVATFLVGTGIRWGELIALTTSDVRLAVADPYISINKAVKRRPGGHYVGTPKSLRSRRLVSLPATLVDIVRPLVAGQPADTTVFRGPRGGRLHHSNVYDRHWKPAVLAAMATHDEHGNPIPDTQRLTRKPRIHDLRHTHASWLIAARVDLPTVQRRLGHESITTTVDRYGHLDPDQLRAGAHAADAVLRSLIAPPDLDPTDDPTPEPAADAAAAETEMRGPRLRLVHGSRTTPPPPDPHHQRRAHH